MVEELNDNGNNVNFNNCIKFVERTFPNESKDIQYKQAIAVYSITNVFFGKIIPNIINSRLLFSDN